MIEIARERKIATPAARVWEVVAEAERLPEWYARAASAEVLEGAGLGRRQRVRSQWQGQDSEVDQLVTAFEPERLLEWRHEAERLGGQPAPRFALETVVTIKLEALGPDATRVVIESRQLPADPEKGLAMRGNSEYLGKMLEASLERLEQLVTRESES
ncbi:MAG TPA: SRPBCC domain-containing protein [Candidatus Dormibacteraeota bacterium]